MWYFRSPEVVYGEDALSHLAQLPAGRVLIVTDPVIHQLGLAEEVARHLREAGCQIEVFLDVEPEPSLQTVRRAAALAAVQEPELIVAVGGGSVMDAAKAILVLYQNPDLDLDGLVPWVAITTEGSRLIAVPTTSGTGSEASWAVVLTDTEQRRKVAVGHPSLIPSLAVIDPSMTRNLPPVVTADTGMDALAHGIEGYTATWHNDFSDGLCLKAVQLVFEFLPRAVAAGAQDMQARERMANAATMAGLGFGNSNAALAHAMGHSLGGYFKVPHGRAVGLFLPYTMAYTLNGAAATRYGDLARGSGLTDSRDEKVAGRALIEAVRSLIRTVGLSSTLRELGIEQVEFTSALGILCDYAESDPAIAFGQRIPDGQELSRLFTYAYEGRPVDF